MIKRFKINRWYIVALIVVLAELLAYFFADPLGLELTAVITVTWFTTVIILLLMGNRWITRQFNRYFPWLKFGTRRFYAHLVAGILYSLIVINLAYLLFKVLLTQDPPVFEQIIVMNAWSVVIFIPLFSIYFSLYFLGHWKRSVLVAEQFQKETVQAELASLKNHLDPHFLFNNLNILSSLIDKSQDRSKVFLDKFAEVYRAILRSKEEDLVSLEEELEFIQAYIYLVKTRFEENIIFEIDIDPADRYRALPPLTLQLLVENAIKHNIISEKHPLRVCIGTSKEGRLLVENSLFLKPGDLVDKGGSGLKNIVKRYAYFTDLQVTVLQDEDTFKVEIPLLEIETV